METELLQVNRKTSEGSMVFVLVAALFLLSGASSLIYQVLWSRMLVFVFGSSTFATSTVLAVFMGGLAIGSQFCGKLADRSRNPLLFYGILEGLIGIWALVTPLLFSWATPIYRIFFESLHLAPILFGLLRLVVAAFILLPPTICMGATLPLLARFITRSLQTVGNRVGTLYAVNTLGAVLGSVAGGFWLIPDFGLGITTLIAASANIFLALSSYGLSKQLNKASSHKSSDPDTQSSAPEGASREIENAESKSPESKSPESTIPEGSSPEGTSTENKNAGLQETAAVNKAVLAVMTGFAFSGALSMIYEVCWTRSLLMIIGSTTYAFTIMLSTFLVGIFLGSYICARFVDRMKEGAVCFGLTQIFVGLGAFLSIKLFGYLPLWNLELSFYMGKDPGYGMLLRFLMASFVLLPISLFLGATFPLAVKVCTRDLSKIGSSVGQLYFLNTLGAIAGAILAGFLVIPALGTQETLLLTALSNLSMGFIFLLLFSRMRIAIKALSAAFLLVLILWVKSFPQLWDLNAIVFAQSDKRRLPPPERRDEYLSFDDWRQDAGSLGKLIYYKEGICANVAVAVAEADGARITSLFTSGHADASDGPDMDNQAMLAVFPLLFRPESKDICVVGWGSGVTAGYALRFPVNKVVCAEIEPLVFETSKFFHKVNFAAEKDKRSILEPSDGRNYLLCADKSFDAIISEPSNPWQAGVCNLFTSEYFKVCSNSLKEDGVFSMWTQINEIPPANLKQIFAALKSSFPLAFVMDSGPGDLVTIALKKPMKLRLNTLDQVLSQKETASSLARFGINSAEDLIARIHVCPAQFEQLIQGAKANSDDRNSLEYAVARSYENAVYVDENYKMLLKHGGGIWDYIDWGNLSPQQKAQKMNAIAVSCSKRSVARAALWANHAYQTFKNSDSISLLAELAIKSNDFSAAAKLIEQGRNEFRSDSRFPGLSGIASYKQGNFGQARKPLKESLSLNPDNLLMRYYLALTYSDLELLAEFQARENDSSEQDPKAVLELLSPALNNQRFLESNPKSILLLSLALESNGKAQEAETLLLAYLKNYANDYIAWRILALNLSGRQEHTRAAYCWNQASTLAKDLLPALRSRLAELKSQGSPEQIIITCKKILSAKPADQEAINSLRSLKSPAQQSNIKQILDAQKL